MQGQSKSVAAGLVAIALWSAAFALSRSLTEKLGVLTAGAAVCLLCGAVGSTASLLLGRHRNALASIPRRRVAALAGLFAAYQMSMYGALGSASSRESFLVVTVVNYLWPGLTILLAVPLLGRRFRPAIIPGMALAVAGVALAAFFQSGASLADLGAGVSQDLAPYGLALVAAVSWALYSNLVARWAEDAGSGLVPFYFLASGLALAGMAALRPEPSAWSVSALVELASLSLGVMLVGYVAWDYSMRKRESELVPSLGYLIPLPSLALSGLYLDINVGPGLIASAALVIAGSSLCAYGGRRGAP